MKSPPVALIERGGRGVQETRLENPDTDETVSMRSKGACARHSISRRPDLGAEAHSDAWRERVRAQMPELPASRRKRLIGDYASASTTTRCLPRLGR